MPRIRALVIAEACNPEWVSVPLEGWSHARALAGLADVRLVTQVRNREAILRAGLVEGRDFTAIDSEKVAGPVERVAQKLRGGKGKGWTTIIAMRRFGFRYFEKVLWKQFERPLRAGEFDLVHQLTPLSPTIPSTLAGKCRSIGVPFLWGPINGGLPWPRGFDAVRRQEKEWLTYVRGAIRYLPGYHRTRRDCTKIIVGSEATLAQMPERYRGKCVYIPENAIDPQRFAAVRTRSAARGRAGGEPIRLLFVGRLVPYKGCDMLLEAAGPMLKAGTMTLEVVGDGPQKVELQGLIERLGVSSAVRMLGWVKHEQLQQHYAGADVFAFPSIREFGGAVALEAMAVGTPALVPAYGGLGELVTDETGWRVAMSDRAGLIAGVRRALEQILADPADVDRKGDLARARVFESFTWQAKARQVLEVWKEVLK